MASLLPPSEESPWFLSVKEGGYVNRKGRVNAFSITLFDENGNPTATYETADPTPRETVEGVTTLLWVPDDPEVTLPGETPGVVEADPASIETGAQGQAVAIYGSEFLPGASVAVSGDGVSVDSVEHGSGSRLTATLSVDAGASPGPRDVTVTNLDGGSGTGVGALTVTGEGGGGSDPVVTEYDDTDPVVGYRKGWHRRESEAASSGGYHERTGSPGGEPPSVRLVFEGEQVTLFYGTSEAGGGADAGAVETRSVTRSETARLRLGAWTGTVEIGSADESVSLVVDGSGGALTVRLLGPSGDLVATGGALLEGLPVSGLDAPVPAPGTYVVRVLDPLGGAASVEVSIARTVRVR